MTEVLEKSLEHLSFYQILAFCTMSIQRQIPNYISFSQKEKWGNPETLNEGIKILQNIILEKRTLTESEANKINEIFEITPDSEEFGSILSSSAQDVCVMLLEALESVATQDKERLISLISLPFHSLRMYIEEKYNLDYNKNNHDEFVNKHELMKNQYNYFEKLIHNIEVEKEIRPEIFQNIEGFLLPV